MKGRNKGRKGQNGDHSTMLLHTLAFCWSNVLSSLLKYIYPLLFILTLFLISFPDTSVRVYHFSSNDKIIYCSNTSRTSGIFDSYLTVLFIWDILSLLRIWYKYILLHVNSCTAVYIRTHRQRWCQKVVISNLLLSPGRAWWTDVKHLSSWGMFYEFVSISVYPCRTGSSVVVFCCCEGCCVMLVRCDGLQAMFQHTQEPPLVLLHVLWTKKPLKIDSAGNTSFFAPFNPVQQVFNAKKKLIYLA